MDTLWRDIRFGARALARSPGFAVVAVVTLALGIGPFSAMFRMVDFFVLNPLPWEHSDRVVSVSEVNLREDANRRAVSSAKYPEWREQARAFEGLAAVGYSRLPLTGGEQVEVAESAQITAGTLALVGIRPFLGRGFLPEDAAPGAAPVAILSNRLWKRVFGAEPEIVGRTIEVEGRAVTVVGVLSQRQFFPWDGTEMLTPLRLDAATLSRTDHRLDVYGRLGADVSIEQARGEMDVVAQRLAGHYPETDSEWGIRVDYTSDIIHPPQFRNAAGPMFGTVAIVLLIACGNVANLQLARGAARRRELAIRSALGASRGQILRQLLTETLLLATIAFPFALLFAQWSLDWLLSIQPVDTRSVVQPHFRMEARSLWFALIVTLSSITFFGLTPALRVSKSDLTADLKQGGERGSRGAGGERLRSSLVIAQIALSVSLVVSAVLLSRWSIRVQAVDSGFPMENLLVSWIALPGQRYPEPEHWKSFHTEVLSRLEVLPGVISASSIASLPLGGSATREFTIRGKPVASQQESPTAAWSHVSSGYFRTLGLPLLQGRPFLEGDREGSMPVVIVNESLSRRYFGAQNPVGEYLVFGDEEARQVVGVVGNVSDRDGDFGPSDLQLYEPYAQRPSRYFGLVLRTNGPPLALVRALRSEVRSVDRLLPVLFIRSMRQHVEGRFPFERSVSGILLNAAGLALVLTVVGVYGVVSYSTTRRTAEFGIRAALGAEPSDIARLVLQQAGVLAAWGVSIGLVLALAMGRIFAASVYDMEGFDPVIFVTVSLVIAGVALAASAIPALRAARSDPMLALQAE